MKLKLLIKNKKYIVFLVLIVNILLTFLFYPSKNNFSSLRTIHRVYKSVLIGEGPNFTSIKDYNIYCGVSLYRASVSCPPEYDGILLDVEVVNYHLFSTELLVLKIKKDNDILWQRSIDEYLTLYRNHLLSELFFSSIFIAFIFFVVGRLKSPDFEDK